MTISIATRLQLIKLLKNQLLASERPAERRLLGKQIKHHQELLDEALEKHEATEEERAQLSTDYIEYLKNNPDKGGPMLQ